jgi:hypothetical protein
MNMLRFTFLLLTPLPFLLCLVAVAARAEQIVEVPTRTGIAVLALRLDVAAPHGGVILLAGGDGNLEISTDQRLRRGRNNTLVRSRELFARRNLLTLVPDLAADLKPLRGARMTAKHAEDIGHIVAYMRGTVAHVTLVGISSAAVSVADAATQLAGAQAPDAVVIVSGLLTHVDEVTPSVSDIPNLDRVGQPILLLSHQDDHCAYSQPSSAIALRPVLKRAARVDHVLLSGGIESNGNPCGPDSHHGFLDAEDQLVDAIEAWLSPLQRK